MNPERPFRIVSGVIREALRSSGRSEVVVAGGGPEETVLVGWMEQAGIPVATPDPGTVARAEGLALEPGPGSPSDPGGSRDPTREWEEGRTWFIRTLAARALARSRGALLLGTETKTLLLLGYHPTALPVLPLGDLYASEILELAGGCTLPPPLQGLSGEVIGGVDSGLRAYLEEGLPRTDAFGTLPQPLPRVIPELLDRAGKSWRPTVLIPKLRRSTLGIDLDL